MIIGRLFDRLLVDEPWCREPENAECGDKPTEKIHPRRRIRAQHADVPFPKPIMPCARGEWFETGVKQHGQQARQANDPETVVGRLAPPSDGGSRAAAGGSEER